MQKACALKKVCASVSGSGVRITSAANGSGLFVRSVICDRSQRLCPQTSKGLSPHGLVLGVAPYTPIEDIEVATGTARYGSNLGP